MKYIYDYNEKLEFGVYKDFVLGIVYIFDPYYIKWCIENIEEFHVKNLAELAKFSTYSKGPSLARIIVGEAGMPFGVHIFKTFAEYESKGFIRKNDNNCFFSKEIMNLNENKYRNESEDNSDDDFESSSNERYHGYNGYDDDTIDNAFDGDPSSTWNVD